MLFLLSLLYCLLLTAKLGRYVHFAICKWFRYTYVAVTDPERCLTASRLRSDYTCSLGGLRKDNALIFGGIYEGF